MSSLSEVASTQRLDPRVVLLGAAAGLSSGAALGVSILTDAPLWMSSTFVFVPGLVAVIALSVGLRHEQQELFLARFRIGMIAGALATFAYDVVRWAVESSGLASTNTFKAIPLFGAGLTGRPSTDGLAIGAGWAFHLCNGLGFAFAYTVMAAGRPIWWAVVFALGLEAAMVLLYPNWLGIKLTEEFLSVSIAGHVAYGVVLGSFARRSL